MTLPLVACLLAVSVLRAEDKADLAVVHRIKAEAFENSQVMDHLFHLTDVIGPRVTNSPQHRAAADWVLRRLKEYGIAEARLEPFNFGRGWSYSRFAAHLLEPSYAPLIGFPLAWTPPTSGPIRGEPVLAVLKSDEDFDKHKGRLNGKIVLIDEPPPVRLSTEPLARRLSEADLAERAQAPMPEPKKPEADEREKRRQFTRRRNRFLREEGALAVITAGYRSDANMLVAAKGGSEDPKDPVPPPMIALMPVHYNRIVRLLEKKLPVRIELEVEARFHDEPLEAVNVIAEIPGRRKKDEVVMLGAHLDSWHGGTGATDNGAGCAVVIEAMRILRALGLEMDRTVRLALWGGEEQGLLGSKAYVKAHFADPEVMALKPEHARLSAYFNLDNGTGRIRGVYLQGNDMVRPIFEAWLAPFADLGATTVTIRDTTGTDHLSFDAVGLPGFQFIQDPVEYGTRTHHSNLDVYDNVQAGDLMQASAILASFVYHAAMREEMLPRKPLPKPKPKPESSEPKPDASTH
jgi:carboxypeptidase Q